jgi:hypothetical protein
MCVASFFPAKYLTLHAQLVALGKGASASSLLPSLSPNDPTTANPAISIPTPTSNPTPPNIEFTILPAPIETSSPLASPAPAPAANPSPIDDSPQTPTAEGGTTPTLAPVVDQALAIIRASTEAELKLTFAAWDFSPLSDPNSYQSRALDRTIEQEDFANMSIVTILQYWILYCIYFATNVDPNNDVTNKNDFRRGFIPQWKNTNGWEETNVNPCAVDGDDGWFGISCEEDQVTEIRLQRNNLGGNFPPEVSLLASDGSRATGTGKLNRLELFNNELLSNNLDDSSWIQFLGSNMQVLNYGSTSFGGSIPVLPPSLVEYDCSFTLYAGDIPELSFAGLDKLELCILDGNNYNSPVPSVFGTLPSLKFLYIREASIVGDLSYMEGMPSIVEHLVDLNPNLSGPLFPFLGALSTLKSFSAADCGLVRTKKVKGGSFS